MNKPGPNSIRVLRLLLASVGGYLFATGFIAFLGTGLPHLSVERSEAVLLGSVLGLAAFLVVIIWAAASNKPIRAAVYILSSAAAMAGFATLMA